MRRRVLLLIIVLLVTGSATGVHASTDCERWFAAYKQQLAHSQAVKRLQAAKIRARRYARMKLAGYIRPKPVVRPHRHYVHKPRMTRAELLRRFNLACGVLPEREADQPIISEETPADFISHRSLDGFIPTLPTSDDNQLASVTPPLFPLTGENPSYANQNGPSMYMPPFGGFPGFPGGFSPGNPHQPSSPPSFFPPPPFTPPPFTPPPPPPQVTPVPEPESIVLLLTGLIGGVGAIRRRLKSSRT